MSWLKVGTIVLMSAFAAAGSPGARAAAPVAIGVSGLASANASIATSGSFVAVAWAARSKMASPTFTRQRVQTRGVRFERLCV